MNELMKEIQDLVSGAHQHVRVSLQYGSGEYPWTASILKGNGGYPLYRTPDSTTYNTPETALYVLRCVVEGSLRALLEFQQERNAQLQKVLDSFPEECPIPEGGRTMTTGTIYFDDSDPDPYED